MMIIETPPGTDLAAFTVPAVAGSDGSPPRDRPALAGVAVFFHGANQIATWRNEKAKEQYWSAMLASGWFCIALKSPDSAWDVRAEERDPAWIGDLLGAVRARFGLAGLRTLYFGFSSGTGPASIQTFRDPDSPGAVLFCAAGSAVAARMHPEAQRTIVFAFNRGDRRVELTPQQIDERWAGLPNVTIVQHEAAGGHEVTWKHAETIRATFGLGPPVTTLARPGGTEAPAGI